MGCGDCGWKCHTTNQALGWILLFWRLDGELEMCAGKWCYYACKRRGNSMGYARLKIRRGDWMCVPESGITEIDL